MSSKLPFIPDISDYNWVRSQMQEDLMYRLENRTKKTSLGRPLYERINVQVIITQECPYNCPFCIERQKPMTGNNDFKKQQESLVSVLREHPNARMTITGGEPGLYPEQVKALTDIYRNFSNNVFVSINSAGYDTALQNYGHLNLSVNTYVSPDLQAFTDFTYQTVLNDSEASPLVICISKKEINIMTGTRISSFILMGVSASIGLKTKKKNRFTCSFFVLV